MEIATSKYSQRWFSLAVLCLTLVIIAIDNTVLNLALPSISENLGASTVQLLWIVDAYTLVFAALLLTTGTLGDRYGRKRLLQIGLVVFGLGSLGAALSTSANMLIAFRTTLGMGGAMMMPSTLSVIIDVFRHPKERAQALAIWGGTFSIGAGVGPLVGGLLLTYFEWPFIFYLNIPIITAGLVGSYFFVPESFDTRVPQPDLPGVLSSFSGLVALVYGIIKAGEAGWQSSEVRVALALAVILLGAFIWWETRSASPMLPMSFFKNMSFTGANIALTLSSFAMMGSLYFFSQYFQSVLGYSPWLAALSLLPMTLITFAATLMSVRIAQKIGTKLTVSLGLLTMGGAFFIFSQLAGIDTAYPILLGPIIILATGMGLTMTPAMNSILSSLPPSRAGIGSAMNDTTLQIGGALGLAVLGALMNATYRAEISNLAALATVSAETGEFIRSSIQNALVVTAKLPADIAQTVINGVKHAFVAGMTEAIFVGAVFMVIASITALLMLPSQIRVMKDEDVFDVSHEQINTLQI